MQERGLSSNMPSFFPIDFSRKEDQPHRHVNKLENSAKKTPIKTINEMEGTAHGKRLKTKLIECKYRLKKRIATSRMMKSPKLERSQGKLKLS